MKKRMMTKHKNLFKRAIFAAAVLSLLTAASTAFADAPLWAYKGAKWYSMLDTGNLLIGAQSGGINCINGETGAVVWQRADLKGVNEDEITELEGTPVLLAADNSGWAQKKTKIFAVDLLTGETIWQTEKLHGDTVQVSPVYAKDMLVFLTIKDNRINKDKPDISALKLSTGESKPKVRIYTKSPLTAANRESSCSPATVQPTSICISMTKTEIWSPPTPTVWTIARFVSIRNGRAILLSA